MKDIKYFEALKALRIKGRKRKLYARNGLKLADTRFYMDARTNQDYQRTREILSTLMNMEITSSVILRRALRLYAGHVAGMAKASKGIKGKTGLYDFLNRLEAERAELLSAACHDTPE